MENLKLSQIKEMVFELLNHDNSGHGMDHVNRVYELAMKFADYEKADKKVVGMAALLHDVDDYKIFGEENAEKLTNAKNIMNKANVDDETQKAVLNVLKNMGYRKSLKGIRPTSLEGKIVSDADMCDGMGSHGIIRTIVYAVSSKGNGIVFDKNVFPNDNITYSEYCSQGTTHSTDNVINHFFEKMLKLPKLVFTDAGKQEAANRQGIMVDFLKQFFVEENAPEWLEYLKNYLRKL